jgi:hypothetical protein
LLVAGVSALAQPQPPDPELSRNRPGPWDNDVPVYRVAPAGEPEKLATFERAGVPTVARLRDGRLLAAHQHFPENDRPNFDKVAVRFSPDEGRTWTAPQVIRVSGLPEGMRFPFDPTLVPLPDGRLRLYFTGNYGRTFQRSTPASVRLERALIPTGPFELSGDSASATAGGTYIFNAVEATLAGGFFRIRAQ